jgi:hypothetical protein
MGTTLQTVVDEDPALAAEEVVAIDLDEFQEAQKDPRVHGFLRQAAEYGARLEREGRNHR